MNYAELQNKHGDICELIYQKKQQRDILFAQNINFSSKDGIDKQGKELLATNEDYQKLTNEIAFLEGKKARFYYYVQAVDALIKMPRPENEYFNPDGFCSQLKSSVKTEESITEEKPKKSRKSKENNPGSEIPAEPAKEEIPPQVELGPAAQKFQESKPPKEELAGSALMARNAAERIENPTTMDEILEEKGITPEQVTEMGEKLDKMAEECQELTQKTQEKIEKTEKLLEAVEPMVEEIQKESELPFELDCSTEVELENDKTYGEAMKCQLRDIFLKYLEGKGIKNIPDFLKFIKMDTSEIQRMLRLYGAEKERLDNYINYYLSIEHIAKTPVDQLKQETKIDPSLAKYIK